MKQGPNTKERERGRTVGAKDDSAIASLSLARPSTRLITMISAPSVSSYEETSPDRLNWAHRPVMPFPVTPNSFPLLRTRVWHFNPECLLARFRKQEVILPPFPPSSPRRPPQSPNRRREMETEFGGAGNATSEQNASPSILITPPSLYLFRSNINHPSHIQGC